MTPDTVSRLVEAQLTSIGDPALVSRIRQLLVTPRPELFPWDYGEPDQRYECWFVLEHRASNTGIAYSEHGFGPSYPWGLVFLSGPHATMGTDASWYLRLEDAVRESIFWECPNPSGYEVP